MKSELETFYPKNRAEWRKWLQENHSSKLSIWVIYYKKKSNIPSISYNEAVEEALCFGWIDSKAKGIDSEKSMQYFCTRKPKSVWSRVNKAKVEALIEAGQMTEAGYASIEIAKQNGSWTILDEAEALIIPADLEKALSNYPEALNYFLSLSRSDQRNILQWLVLAKRPETRANRIKEIAELAEQKLKPRPFR
jgi:uncharacterized protein YdeI (YjbR/CyaY-like superfamily)